MPTTPGLPGFGVMVLLGLAGACGAAVRIAISEWLTKHMPGRFPLATLLINVTGAFALGLLLTAGGAHDVIVAQTRLLLGTGFLGGYTTFSTLSYDTHSLYRRNQRRAAWLNTIGSLAIGIAAAALGIALGSLV